jgi:hypothetical protein
MGIARAAFFAALAIFAYGIYVNVNKSAETPVRIVNIFETE